MEFISVKILIDLIDVTVKLFYSFMIGPKSKLAMRDYCSFLKDYCKYFFEHVG